MKASSVRLFCSSSPIILLQWQYEEQHRIGDHIWWISDIRKFQSHYPKWKFRYGLREILNEIHHAVSRNPITDND